jgi:hypothetical protein
MAQDLKARRADLEARLSELGGRLSSIVSDVKQEHSADAAEQAQERENDEVLDAIGNETRESIAQRKRQFSGSRRQLRVARPAARPSPEASRRPSGVYPLHQLRRLSGAAPVPPTLQRHRQSHENKPRRSASVCVLCSASARPARKAGRFGGSRALMCSRGGILLDTPGGDLRIRPPFVGVPSRGFGFFKRLETDRVQNQRIRIRLKAFDHRLIDSSTQEIVETARRTGAQVRGPIPLPTRKERSRCWYHRT